MLRFSGTPGSGPARTTGLRAAANAPVLIAPGRISWSADGSVGQTYSLTPAIWSRGVATRRWYRERLDSGRSRAAILGAINPTFVPGAGEVGYRLLCIETNGGVTSIARALTIVLPAPLLLESYDDPAAHAVSGTGATIAADSTNRVQGAAALRIERAPSFNQLTRADLGQYDPATLGTIAYHYIAGAGDPELAQVGAMGTVALGQSASYGGTVTDGSSEGNQQQNDYRALEGAWMAMHASESPTIQGYSPSQPIGVKTSPFQSGAPGNGITIVDALMAQAEGRPTVILGFDDIPANQFTVVKPLLDQRGMKGTFYVPVGQVGQPQKMTEAQLLQLNAEGHDLQLNGSASDQAMTSFADVQAVIDDLATQRAWFAARGLPAPAHLCYPNGQHRTAGTRVQLSGVTFTAGSASCTVSSAAGIAVGMKVTSPAVARSPAVTVSAINGTTITLSAAATATGSFNATFVAAGAPFHTGRLPAALRAAGIRSARTTVGGSWFTRFGPSGRALVHPGQTTSLQSYAQLKAPLDLAVLRGTTLEYYIHSATASPVGTEVAVAALTSLLDDLAARRDAGTIDVLTKAQWWQRDGAAACPV